MSKASAYFTLGSIDGKHAVKEIRNGLDTLPGVFSVSRGESNPARFSRANSSQYCAKSLENTKGYSLRNFTCLDCNLLPENCEAPLSEEICFGVWCGGRSLADARQGQQSKIQTNLPLRGWLRSTPLGLSVNDGSRRVAVDFDTTGTKKESICKKIEEMGFEVLDSKLEKHIM